MAEEYNKPKAPVISKESDDFKHIVRVMNTDLKGEFAVYKALRKIKGISFPIANAICSLLNLDKSKRIGDFSDEGVSKLNEFVTKLNEFVPAWMKNRKKDPETGEDKHILTTDINFVQDNDIKILKKIKSYKGQRHSYRLPVRGQRTKSNFRRNKGKVTGVKRKAGVKAGRS